ncbi:hypothetical protein [Alcanivorax sp.]|uniref:hypothetical protein n=1 Tax=Alcanivorax sp. TaxID=1872427 RepID=UPI003BA95ADC
MSKAMKVSWKKIPSLKPNYILDKIEKTKSVDGNGDVSFDGFLYFEAFIALMTMLKFDEVVKVHIDIEKVVSSAIANSARSGPLDQVSVLKEINKMVDERLSGKSERYDLLTSISISPELGFSEIEIEGVKIRFVESYHEKYEARDEEVESQDLGLSSNHDGYSKVVVSVYSKDSSAAASRALRSLDLLRSLFCLFGNHEMELIGPQNQPINVVVLGQAHSLHASTGELVQGTCVWYEPQFRCVKPFKGKMNFKANVDAFLSRLSDSPLRKSISNSLLLYVRGLDEVNYNSAVVQVWSGLESLLSPSTRNSV